MTSIYKKQLSQLHKKLDRTSQINLYNKIQEGDQDARDKVIHSCLPLVINLAQKFRCNNKHIDLYDMIQEGNIALIKAVDNWDVNKGNITTVVTWYVKNTLIDMINDAKYKIILPYTLSRRAAEELRKVKNVRSTDINFIAKETGLNKRKIKKLLSISPPGMTRVGINDASIKKNVRILEDDIEKTAKPCIGDLISLINTTLDGDQKTIYSMWAGINTKKIGKKQIAISLGKTEQYVYDNIKNATRLLSKAAKKVNSNA